MTQTIQTELPPIKVGDVLYREVKTHRSNPEPIIEPVRVAKIGRKYLYLWFQSMNIINKHHPVDLTTLRYSDECGNYSFQLHRTRQEIDDKNETQELWEAFRKQFYWSSRNRFTLDQLREAARVLGIDVGETT